MPGGILEEVLGRAAGWGPRYDLPRQSPEGWGPGPGQIVSDCSLGGVVGIFGSESSRGRIGLELVLREAEAGHIPMMIDMMGRYSPLIDYIPSLRVYRVGEYASVNPFAPAGDRDEYAQALSSFMQDAYDLSRDERVYLERAIALAYADGNLSPSLESITDNLLRIEAEIHPREGYKVESLKNVLWELGKGATGLALQAEGLAPKMPAIFDLSAIEPVRAKAFLAASLLLKAREYRPTEVLIDPAEWLLQPSVSGDPRRAQGAISALIRSGTSIRICSLCPSLLPRWIVEASTACIFCGPLWEGALSFIGRAFRLDPGASIAKAVGDCSALLCMPNRGSPQLIRFRRSRFRSVADVEILEHMRTLGDDPRELKGTARRRGMLEKIFREREAAVYAVGLLRLIKGGRVPVDAVVHQRNRVLRTVVKVLKRYFLIVEYCDNSGAGWFKLTKVGERALAEFEDGGTGE